MTWKYLAGGCLAFLLLTPGAWANTADPHADPSSVANILEPATDEVPTGNTEPDPDDDAAVDDDAAPLPWAELLDGNLQQPLRVGEYNRVMATLWAALDEQHSLRSSRINAACDALGRDMRYLRGRVPRQIEDARRQMAPFQTKGLIAGLNQDQITPGSNSHHQRANAIGIDDYADSATILELIRSGEDPPTYETYRQLLSEFVNLNLDNYLDPAQDELPLSRSEFLGYIGQFYQSWQDPTGGLRQHEQFLQESDQIIQELLYTLREVRRLLAILEATKANGDVPQSEVFKAVIIPSAPQLAQYTTLTNAPVIDQDDDAFVTRYDFLLAMVALLSSLEAPLYRPSFCGDYQMDSVVDAKREMQWEVVDLLRSLDSLNLEILELIEVHSR